MAFASEFIPIQLRELPEVSKKMKADGARFVQLLAVHEDLGNALVYSFMKDDALLNYRIENVGDGVAVPSITGEYLNAFVFENEVHDLFGVNITDIAIDFKGKFYKVAEPTPMCTSETIKKEMAAGAAKAKAETQARAAAAAKAKAEAEAKAKAEAEGKAEDKPAEAPKEAPKVQEKPAEAKKEAPAVDEALEKKLAGMDPEKAAKVRAAMEAKAKKAAEAAKKEVQ